MEGRNDIVDWFNFVFDVLTLTTGWRDSKKDNSYPHTDHHVTYMIETTSSLKHNTWQSQVCSYLNYLLQKHKPNFPLVRYILLYFIWPHQVADGILFPQPGIEPAPLALEGRVLTTELPGKSRIRFIIRVQKIPSNELPKVINSQSIFFLKNWWNMLTLTRLNRIKTQCNVLKVYRVNYRIKPQATADTGIIKHKI